MNYNLVQTTYFLIFIVIATTFIIAIPHVKTSLADASDAYATSQMKRIQAEMFFAEQKRGSFQHACYSGSIGVLVQDLISEYGKKVICRTNNTYSEMIVYVELRAGDFFCVDSRGVSCNTAIEPRGGFSCKDF